MTRKVKNRLEIWLSSRKGELTPATYPNVIAVEPTNFCNLSCPMCPRTSLMKREKGLMDFSLFKKIVDESKGRTEFMYIDNMGDPLIHPKICEMIGYASKNGIRMLLGTNGAFLTGDLAACLLQNGPDLIELSIDAANSRTYESVRGGKNYEQVVNNVISFAEAKRSASSTKPFTILQFVKTIFKEQTKIDPGTVLSEYESLSSNNSYMREMYIGDKIVKSCGGTFSNRVLIDEVCVKFYFYFNNIAVPKLTRLWMLYGRAGNN